MRQLPREGAHSINCSFFNETAEIIRKAIGIALAAARNPQ